MDREPLFAVLALLGTGPLLLLAGIGWYQSSDTASARDLERACWRALWIPLLPVAIVLFALVGWALLEPDNAERLPNLLLVAAIPCGGVWLRAAVRAFANLIRSPRVSTAAKPMQAANTACISGSIVVQQPLAQLARPPSGSSGRASKSAENMR